MKIWFWATRDVSLFSACSFKDTKVPNSLKWTSSVQKTHTLESCTLINTNREYNERANSKIRKLLPIFIAVHVTIERNWRRLILKVRLTKHESDEIYHSRKYITLRSKVRSVSNLSIGLSIRKFNVIVALCMWDGPISLASYTPSASFCSSYEQIYTFNKVVVTK